jgi:hypothetical protein
VRVVEGWIIIYSVIVFELFVVERGGCICARKNCDAVGEKKVSLVVFIWRLQSGCDVFLC